LFGLIQFYVGSASLILFAIPVALLGWILPFYYGYLRGAIADSMADRYRGWVVLVVGLGLYAVLVAEERVSRLFTDPRLGGFVAAISLSPFLLLTLKYSRPFKRFVLGSKYPANEILSQSATNIVSAAFAIALAGGLMAIVSVITVWDLTIVVPLGAIAFYYIRKSNYFAERISFRYEPVEKKGPLHGRRSAKRAYRILKTISFSSFVIAAVPALFLDFGYTSDLLFPIVYAALGAALLFALPTLILHPLIRTRHTFVFQPGQVQEKPANNTSKESSQ
jgi:hypothetical protein